MAKNLRNLKSFDILDPGTIHNLEYNNAAGSKKVSEVGRHLLPLPIISGGVLAFTTDSSTARALPYAGACLAVYNNSGSLGSVTLGEDGTVSSLASGVTSAGGHVGIPCAPNAWTYIACGSQNWVISSAATLLTFIVDDNTSVKPEIK